MADSRVARVIGLLRGIQRVNREYHLSMHLRARNSEAKKLRAEVLPDRPEKQMFPAASETASSRFTHFSDTTVVLV